MKNEGGVGLLHGFILGVLDRPKAHQHETKLFLFGHRQEVLNDGVFWMIGRPGPDQIPCRCHASFRSALDQKLASQGASGFFT